MAARARYDAVVVGSGPNGLTCAVALARAGLSVLVREAMPTPGGGTRTEELTLPGFKHDVCSAAHPLGVGSPYLEKLPLREHGLEWVHPEFPFAHPLDGGRAVVQKRSLEETAQALGEDGPAWVDLYGSITQNWDRLAPEILAPMLRLPRHPILLARFGLQALRSARALVESRFKTQEARALFGGIAASAAIGIVLGAAGHARGWPIARGGSHAISDALVSYLKTMGGELETGTPVQALSELPPSRWIFFDLPPLLVSRICEDELPRGFRRKLERFKRGPGVFKLDWALDGPIPWEAPECRKAATIHLGGTFDELSASERAVASGRAPEKPYVLLTQPSLFDSSRAPAGKHTAWAYCHVPNGSTEDFTGKIEVQIERFAPGFRKRILRRSVLSPAELERRNPALLGGDISGGAVNLAQVLARPRLSLFPYRTPSKRVFLCSSSTPPGPGVHGMCGYLAAKDALSTL